MESWTQTQASQTTGDQSLYTQKLGNAIGPAPPLGPDLRRSLDLKLKLAKFGANSVVFSSQIRFIILLKSRSDFEAEAGMQSTTRARLAWTIFSHVSTANKRLL